MDQTNVGAIRFYWPFVPLHVKEDRNIQNSKIGGCIISYDFPNLRGCFEEINYFTYISFECSSNFFCYITGLCIRNVKIKNLEVLK